MQTKYNFTHPHCVVTSEIWSLRCEKRENNVFIVVKTKTVEEMQRIEKDSKNNQSYIVMDRKTKCLFNIQKLLCCKSRN